MGAEKAAAIYNTISSRRTTADAKMVIQLPGSLNTDDGANLPVRSGT